MTLALPIDMPDTNLPIVLVTGSSGFLGQAITRGLMGRYRVMGLDVKQPKEPLDGVDTLEIDLTSDESVAETLAKVRRIAGGRGRVDGGPPRGAVGRDPVRFLNAALGACVAAAPFVLQGAAPAGTISDVLVGLALIGLSLPRGKRSDEHYGGWDRLIV